jgi:multiple sugar transport system permease protein
VAIVWRAMFIDDGIADQVQQFFGLPGGGWVGDPNMTMPMMILLAVWQFGAPMVIFLAGLKQIPAELLEAAEVDGAGPVRRFVSVTIPLLSPVLFFNLLLETIGAFQVFSSAFIISGGTGGPADSTLFYTFYLYIKGFTEFRMGYASAMAWVLVLVVGIITAVLFRTSRAWVHYTGDVRWPRPATRTRPRRTRGPLCARTGTTRRRAGHAGGGAPAPWCSTWSCSRSPW